MRIVATEFGDQSFLKKEFAAERGGAGFKAYTSYLMLMPDNLLGTWDNEKTFCLMGVVTFFL